MSDQRDGGIAWTDQTWNPTRGCSRVSKGCEHCYAENVARRFSGPGQPYEGLVRLDRDGKAKAQWNGVVRLVPDHLGDPLRWKRPRRVFVNSMSDLFHEALSFEDIAEVFGVMAAAERHAFQVLTKRPENARAFFARFAAEYPDFGALPNVWLGVSVEDQASADERIPQLLACPASVRWVSYEPAIGPVRFDRIWNPGGESSFNALRRWVDGGGTTTGIDWIVVGGESGPGARPFDLAWARSAIAQCREAGVPCFVKQLGAVPHVGDAGAGWAVTYGERGRHWRMDDDTTDPLTVYELRDRKGGDPSEWPEDLRVRQWPEVRRG